MTFLSLKNDVNVRYQVPVPTFKSRNKQNLKKIIFIGVLKVINEKAGSGAGSGFFSQRYGSADPDPYQNVTDPEH